MASGILSFVDVRAELSSLSGAGVESKSDGS